MRVSHSTRPRRYSAAYVPYEKLKSQEHATPSGGGQLVKDRVVALDLSNCGALVLVVRGDCRHGFVSTRWTVAPPTRFALAGMPTRVGSRNQEFAWGGGFTQSKMCGVAHVVACLRQGIVVYMRCAYSLGQTGLRIVSLRLATLHGSVLTELFLQACAGDACGAAMPVSHCPPAQKNELKELPGAVLARLPLLQILDVSYNSIKVLPLELGRLQELRELNIRWNLCVLLRMCC